VCFELTGGNLIEKIKWVLGAIHDRAQIAWRYKNWTEILVKIHRKQRITRVVLRNGVQIEAPESHPFLLGMTNETFFNKVHTSPDLQIEEDDVVVDIGANIGIVTLFAALRTKKSVHAFEPSSENCEFLNRNILANGLRNVVVHNVAVGDETEKLTRLYIGDSVGHSLLHDECRTEKYIEVPTVTLQDIMDNVVIGEIGFLKIDCEGCEGLIFSSTPVEYFRRVKKMEVEFHDASSPLKHDAIQRLMEEAGFKVRLHWMFGEDSPYGVLHGKRLVDAQRGLRGSS
jgi:FkbM family methyltransferase